MKTDTRLLDMSLLKTLDALLDERSVTRAAARLSLTQPAVSGMLKRLRDYFGDLHSRALYDETYVCMLRTGHPDASQPLTLEHVLVSYEGESFHGVTDYALAQMGRTRHVGLSVSSFLVLPEILAISDMIAVVPGRMAENRKEMVTCAPPLPIAGFTKSMAWHGRTHRHPAQV